MRKCGPWTGSCSITKDLTRNAHSQVPAPRVCWKWVDWENQSSPPCQSTFSSCYTEGLTSAIAEIFTPWNGDTLRISVSFPSREQFPAPTGSHPNPLNPELWKWGPAVHVLTSFPVLLTHPQVCKLLLSGSCWWDREKERNLGAEDGKGRCWGGQELELYFGKVKKEERK